jgi:CO dehydrogenase maturation factor
VRGVIAQLEGGAETGVAERDVHVIDMEASIEHLSRGTLRYVDALLIVVEPYFRALETAARTVKLARDLQIPHLFAVANKVRSPQDEQAVRDYCAGHDLPVMAVVPFDEEVTRADRAGAALFDAAPESAAVRAVAALVEELKAQLGL